MAEMLRLRKNEAGTGTDPAAAAPGISEDTGLADAAGGAGAADRSMAEAGAAVTESLVLDFADTDKLAWPVNGNNRSRLQHGHHDIFFRRWTSIKSTRQM